MSGTPRAIPLFAVAVLVQAAFAWTPGAGGAEADWRVGLAQVSITPDEPVWLYGYAGKNRFRPFEGVLDDIYAEAMAVAVDVRERASVQQMVDSALDRFGKIDILVNNAGGSARERNAFFHELPDEVLDWVLGVNLLGPLFCIRSVINHMVERRQGKIVNIASIVGMHGKQKLADYSAAKGGIIAFTKSLAMEVGPYNFNVNCVSPGLVPRSPKEYEGAASRSYLGRH